MTNSTELLLEHTKATLSFNQDTNCIELIWKQFQDEQTYKMLFNKGLNSLIEKKATCWLSDIRNEGVVGPSTSNWMKTEILPVAFKNGLQKIAIVMDADVFKTFYVKNFETIKEASLKMRYFDSIDDARKWLKEEVVASAAN